MVVTLQAVPPLVEAGAPAKNSPSSLPWEQLAAWRTGSAEHRPVNVSEGEGEGLPYPGAPAKAPAKRSPLPSSRNPTDYGHHRVESRAPDGLLSCPAVRCSCEQGEMPWKHGVWVGSLPQVGCPAQAGSPWQNQARGVASSSKTLLVLL